MFDVWFDSIFDPNYRSAVGSSRFGTSDMDDPKGQGSCSDDQLLDASFGRRPEQTCEDIRLMAAWRNRTKLRRRWNLSSD